MRLYRSNKCRRRADTRCTGWAPRADRRTPSRDRGVGDRRRPALLDEVGCWASMAAAQRSCAMTFAPRAANQLAPRAWRTGRGVGAERRWSPLVIVLLGAARAALRTHTDLALENTAAPTWACSSSVFASRESFAERRVVATLLFVQLPRHAPSFDPAAATSFIPKNQRHSRRGPGVDHSGRRTFHALPSPAPFRTRVAGTCGRKMACICRRSLKKIGRGGGNRTRIQLPEESQ
jgi:hypothetical protein